MSTQALADLSGVTGQVIRPDDADYEVSRGEIQPAVHVHVACYQAWRGESQRSA